MSETVKLIIEIPKEDYELARTHRYTTKPLFDAVVNAIPLDDVLDKISAEIDEKLSHYEHFSSSNTANGLMIAKDIIEKYKAESEDKK